MSLEVKIGEDRVTEKTLVALYRALDFELVGAIEGAGIELLGLSVKMDGWDCLLTIRASRGADAVVCFVGSDSLVNCFLKAVRDAQMDKLRWKEDRFAKK